MPSIHCYVTNCLGSIIGVMKIGDKVFRTPSKDTKDKTVQEVLAMMFEKAAE